MALDSLKVDLTVVLGKTRMPLQRLLRLGRGAVVAFDGLVDEPVEILANGHPIARGRVRVQDGSIAVEVTELVRKPEVTRIPGSTVGGRIKVADAAPALAEAA